MDAAVGEYVIFVDDDDLLLPGAVDALYEKAAETKSDMVYGGYQRLGREGEVLKHYPHEYIEGSGRELTRLYLRDTCYTHGGAYLLSGEHLLQRGQDFFDRRFLQRSEGLLCPARGIWLPTQLLLLAFQGFAAAL